MHRYLTSRILFGLFLVILAVAGCKKKDDSSPNPDSQLVITPAKVFLNDDVADTLYMTTQPATNAEWRVTAKPGWLTITPSSGSVDEGTKLLILKGNPEGLSEGAHVGTVDFVTNGIRNTQLEVNLWVNSRPVAGIDPLSLDFPADVMQQPVTVTNKGNGYLFWKLSPGQSWLNFIIDSGVLLMGESVVVNARVNRAGLQAGSYSGKVTLTGNSMGGNIELPVTMTVPMAAYLELSDTAIDFNFFTDSVVVMLRNRGNVASSWSIGNAPAYLSTKPQNGQLAAGDSIPFTVYVNRDPLQTQTYQASLMIHNSAGPEVSLGVTVNNFKDGVWHLNSRIVDAEYDRVGNVIIAVSDTPVNRLMVINPETKTIQSIPLNLPPVCVSVSPDGKYAAVGHDGKVTHVSLASLQILNVFNVSAIPSDIVIAPNNFAYVFPEGNGWCNIHCIDLASGTESLSTGYDINEGTKAKLHPSGIFIYGADNNVSPSDFEKYDISGGTAHYLYDSPYHGDYDFGGDIWIADDGNRLFARSRNVFLARTDQSLDMTYNGKLTGERYLKTLDMSSASKRIYAVQMNNDIWNPQPSKEVIGYESDYLNYLGTYPLPQILAPTGGGNGALFDSYGYWGFFNSTGMKYFAVVKADVAAGAQDDWGVVTLEVR
jgi:hypothetical protein